LFGAPTTINPVPGAGSISVGDFNGDGIPDLLTVNVTDSATVVADNISVLFGNGDGTFQRPVTSPRPPAVLGPAVVADFNGDGILDVAAVSPFTNSVSVFLGNGNGTFQGPQSFAVDQGPRGLATGDFNGDGFPDLATANFGATRDVSVLINAADWSTPVGSAVLPLSAYEHRAENGSSTPSGSPASALPPWVSAATDGVLAASTAEAGGLGPTRLGRGVREDRDPGGTDLFVRPEGLPWDRSAWPFG
jgi:hypothetical protein